MLKLIALGYLVKTIVVGAAWLAVPDLPQRAMAQARLAWAWAWAKGDSPAPPGPAVPAPAAAAVVRR